MIELPMKPTPPSNVNPRRLFIFSNPKVGKSSLLAALPNSLLIDAEDGSNFLHAAKINIIEEAVKQKKPPYTILKEVSEQLAKSTHRYDYICLDTATALEDIAKELAVILYKNTPMGKNFTGTEVQSLANGAGYMYVREAFEKLYQLFDPYAAKCLILTGHVKKASITKELEGKELSARDIDLIGKLKNIVCSQSDAIGFLYRRRESTQNILSFRTSEDDLATGARPEHLRNQEIVISEYIDGKVVTYWDKVFI